MSSIVERLTEGVVNRDMHAEGHALLNKWEKTGLLEGISKDRSRSAMARLLENQAKELLRESSSMAAGDVEGFAAVAFPIVRRVFAGLIANDLVSVQPMSLPSGLIFFLDFTFSPNIGETGAQPDRFGNLANKSIYGTDRVGSQITGGVNLVDSQGGDLSGPRTVGANGYAYGSPSGSATVTTANLAIKGQFALSGVSETNGKLIDWDPDLLALGNTYKAVVVDTNKSVYTSAQADFNNLGAFEITASERDDCLSGSTLNTVMTGSSLIRRLTSVVSASESGTSNEAVRYVFVVHASRAGTLATTAGTMSVQVPATDDITTGGAIGSVIGQTEWGLEGNADIPEIDIKVDSIAVTAMTKKLKAKWTPELGQDLNAYHNLDA